MPSSTAPPPEAGAIQTSNATISVRISDVVEHDILCQYAREVPGAEPPPEELRAERRSPLVAVVAPVADSRWKLLYGRVLLVAARAAGAKTVRVAVCPDCDGLNDAELALKAAGLHLKAARDRLNMDPFEFQLAASKLYRVWVANLKRRPPRRRDEAKQKKWKTLRQKLIKEAFGRAQRTLERDSALGRLPDPIRDAHREGRLPARAIEAVEKLPVEAVTDLGKRLAGGSTFAELESEFFGAKSARRKSTAGAVRAILASLRTIAEEAGGRGHCVALPAEYRADAKKVSSLLSKWLAAPARKRDVNAEVRRLAVEVVGKPVKARRPSRGGYTRKAAARGGRGASGVRS